jgi:hypothetical protein
LTNGPYRDKAGQQHRREEEEKGAHHGLLLCLADGRDEQPDP